MSDMARHWAPFGTKGQGHAGLLGQAACQRAAQASTELRRKTVLRTSLHRLAAISSNLGVLPGLLAQVFMTSIGSDQIEPARRRLEPRVLALKECRA
jgi:hypothetical protein